MTKTTKSLLVFFIMVCMIAQGSVLAATTNCHAINVYPSSTPSDSVSISAPCPEHILADNQNSTLSKSDATQTKPSHQSCCHCDIAGKPALNTPLFDVVLTQTHHFPALPISVAPHSADMALPYRPPNHS